MTMISAPRDLNPPACIADLLACLDQFQSEIGAKLDRLAALEAAAAQRERKWTTVTSAALLCAVPAVVIAIAYSFLSLL
jgi:hypothetical protein